MWTEPEMMTLPASHPVAIEATPGSRRIALHKTGSPVLDSEIPIGQSVRSISAWAGAAVAPEPSAGSSLCGLATDRAA